MQTKTYCSKRATLFLLLIFILGFKSSTQAQEKNKLTFQIKEKGNVTDIQPYIDAMEKADMSNHRLRDQRHTITFKTGLIIELFSATELVANGYNVQPSQYQVKINSQRKEPVFDLAPNDYIIECHTSGQKHH